jgi:putative ATPase
MVAAEQASQMGSRTILFVDEIHRFNKAQQDAFLPYVERGTIRLIGATTENPSFEIIAALLSRCRVYTLKRSPKTRSSPSCTAPSPTKNAASARSISPPTKKRSTHRQLLQRRLPQRAYNALEVAAQLAAERRR